MPLPPGTSLGRYEIRSKLGEGGMGEVYLARDTSELGRDVALKILPAAVASDQRRMQRFLQEARTVSALNHPNILTIHEIGNADGTRFIVTEYVDGVTLREHMRGRRQRLHEVLEIAMQVAAALDAAHEAKVVHRDIKPENIMLRRRDQIIKVLDFGLAKLTEDTAGEGSGQSVDTEAGTKVLVHTQPGMVMGTAGYMSPEQSQGSRDVDHRTDLWSLGVVLYEMVAGRLPFEGKDVHRQIIAVQESDAAPMSRYAEGVPARLEEIVEKALAKSPDERYQTAKDFLIDLRNLKRRLEVDAEIERTGSPGLRSTSQGSKEGTAPAQPDTATQTARSAEAAGQSPGASFDTRTDGRTGRRKLAALAALLAVSAAAVGLVLYLRSGRGAADAIESIAVLPFTNQNKDPETEYRSDGLTESIINSLTRLPSLKVAARSTVFRYKGREADPLAVGKELGVRAVLTGRVMQRGEQLSVSVELLDVGDNKQLWGEHYERKVSDLLAVEREIAEDVSASLRPKLSGAERARVTKSGTENPEAYQLYLKGRFYLHNIQTEEGNQKALEFFNRAVALDPNYAQAYAGLADGYAYISGWANAPGEVMPKAKAAAMKALEFDDSLAEAHASLAMILFRYDRDWAGAEKEIKRALELGPRSREVHIVYLDYLGALGRFDELMNDLRLMKEIDPLSAPTKIFALIGLGRYDEALAEGRRAVDRYPNGAYAHLNLGVAYLKKGRVADAVPEFERARQLDNSPFHMGNLGEVYGLAGRKAEAQKVLDELKELSKRRYVSPYSIAQVYAGLGDHDQAFAWLGKALEEPSDYLAYLKVDWSMDPLRSDPRFADLVRKVGIP